MNTPDKPVINFRNLIHPNASASVQDKIYGEGGWELSIQTRIPLSTHSIIEDPVIIPVFLYRPDIRIHSFITNL